MSLRDWVDSELRRLAEAELLRVSTPSSQRDGFIDAFSNDYFGLARATVSRATLLGRSPGSGASRLIYGTSAEHERLESNLADWVHLPAALVFSSGYAANLGVLTALADPNTLIVSDELNHASIIDGCRLARAEVRVVPHLDVAAVEAALASAAKDTRCLVATESYFSMDGDSPDLASLREITTRHGAGLIVDEAHALGVFGPAGAGLCAAAGITPDIVIGTLGKAVGVQGAFVASSAPLRTLLWNRARSFVFSTATSPALSALINANVEILREAHAQRATLLENASRLRTAMSGLVAEPIPNIGPIVPLRTGSWKRAKQCEDALREHGILSRAVRPPTVPAGTDRVRLTAHADWERDVPDRIAAALRGALA